MKHCGLRKPPVEKQDASSVQSGADLVMLLFGRATQPEEPARLCLETNRGARDIADTQKGSFREKERKRWEFKGRWIHCVMSSRVVGCVDM